MVAARTGAGEELGREGDEVGVRPLRSWSPVFSSCLVLILLIATLLTLRPAEHKPSSVWPYPWLFLRDNRPLGSDEVTAEIVVVGDVMMSRGVADEPRPFAEVAPALRIADVAMGNLECVISGDSGGPRVEEGDPLGPLRAPPSAASRLRRAGFDILGLANNHANDLGPAVLSETASRLQAAGISVIGAGPDAETAFRGVVEDVDGVRLAFLAFNAVTAGRTEQEGQWMWAGWDLERVGAAVEAAREGADAVIVSVHWGYEYQTRVDPAQRDAARMLLQVGADLVVGHHPHVVQALQVVDERCVAYSLGNFVFDQGQGETGKALALRAVFDRRGLRAVQALPVRAGVRPRVMEPGESQALLARLGTPRLKTFVCGERACHTIGAPPPEAEDTRFGLFWGGRTDLSGDGVPEHVRRTREQVVIHSNGAEVWRSPAAWRVVDAALGDPNDDGRSEILLALWKPGPDGLEVPSSEDEWRLRSHPFIIGYRGGIYRTLWGGSAVSEPICEVELADVDGDGDHDLIVLESADARLRAVSVWRWHGWGFSRMWRSAPGAYRNLTVGQNGVICVVVE